MSRSFTLIKDYYEEGFDLFKNKSITIENGITVLVGCNGIGKTTLLSQIERRLKHDHIPCIKFDNLHDGGNTSVQNAEFYGNLQFFATAICSSEGENIIMNINDFALKLGQFVKDGIKEEDSELKHLLTKIYEEEMDENIISNERWILLDAVDSGLSVDNVVDIKEDLFKVILEYNFGNDVYIIVSANEYEMARNERCFDVYNGEYIKFNDYEEYRKFIIDSRKWKNNRNNLTNK